MPPASLGESGRVPKCLATYLMGSSGGSAPRRARARRGIEVVKELSRQMACRVRRPPTAVSMIDAPWCDLGPEIIAALGRRVVASPVPYLVHLPESGDVLGAVN